jgi:hypothetical protein
MGLPADQFSSYFIMAWQSGFLAFASTIVIFKVKPLQKSVKLAQMSQLTSYKEFFI